MSSLFSIGVFIIFFAAAVRPTTDEGISVALPEIFLFVSNYGGVVIVLGVLFLLYITRKIKAEINKISIYYLLLAFLIYRSLIILLEIRSDLWIKYLQSLVLMSAIIFSTLKIKSQFFITDKFPCRGLLLWANFSILVGLYFMVFKGDYGVHAGRFYGFFSHPNFAAISHAVCGVYFFVLINKYTNSAIEKIIFSILFLINIYLLIGTGSRTGFVALAGGFSVVFLSQLMSGEYKNILYIFLFVVIAYFLINMLGGNGFEAGLDRIVLGENTRIDVWSYMYKSFLSSPLYGVGLTGVDTAGSYIRAFGAGGIILGFSLSAFVFIVFYYMHSNILFGDNIMYYALIVTIIFAGIFEGILLEALGFSLVVLSISVASLE